ncbi:MAG: glycosyltransferase family 4 protein [Acidobacteriaceae bacterium]|nr:glycosyltransferase family 4 protein [Acidobacteriaceae bacterium]
MTCRVVLITEIIAPYRVPVFNALARQPGIDLHVIFLAETDPTQRQWLVPKADIQFAYEILPSWRRRIYGRNILLNWGMGEILQHISADVIVCGGYNYFASWEALRWARRNDKPFLLWVESTAQDSRSGSVLVENLKLKFIRQCDGFVVPGKSSFEYLRSYDLAEDRVFPAPNAVDNTFFSQAAWVARQTASVHREAFQLPGRYFLFVGRLEPEKGIFDLLDAYLALPGQVQRDLGLVFVGDGSARSHLKRQVEAANSDLIRIIGFLQREQLAILYGLADIFVFPTHTDPWGLVVNEAMACGLPVICSKAAGCAADLVDDANGRLVGTADVAQLLAALNELASNPKMRLSMSQQSLRKIQQYSPEACAAGIANAVLANAEVRPEYV